MDSPILGGDVSEKIFAPSSGPELLWIISRLFWFGVLAGGINVELDWVYFPPSVSWVDLFKHS